MKLKSGQIPAALKALDPSVGAVLLFGRDEGLIREYAQTLTRQVLGSEDDPFRHIRLTQESLKETPSRLADEMAALSFTPGRRVVRLDGAADAVITSIEAALDGPASDSLLLLVAGDLAPKSKLRKRMEGHKTALAIACYADEGAALDGLIRQTLRDAKLTADRDAMAYLITHLGGDRALSRQELDKLVLYMDGADSTKVTLADAQACVGDAAAQTLTRLAALVTAGQLADLDQEVERAYAAGQHSVAILRTVARRFQQLHLMRGHMADGLDAKAAVQKLTPPPLWKDKDGLVADAGRWSLPKLSRALAKLVTAELAAKTTGQPDRLTTHRTLIEITAAGR